jgi:hypothetical protein
VHDAILCSEAGAPATAVITQPFRKLATQTAANLGMTGFEVMFIEHPVWTRKDDWIEATAKDVADRLIPVLFKS